MTTRIFARHGKYFTAVAKEALNYAERDDREIIQLQSLIDTEERQNFKHKFPFGFSYDIHLLGIG